MPNIEIHGLETGPFAEADAVEALIKTNLKGASYFGMVVVTCCNDRVRDLNGEPQPYLRLVTTEDTFDRILPDLMERLEPLRIGIEVAPLMLYRPPYTIEAEHTERTQLIAQILDKQFPIPSDASNADRGRLGIARIRVTDQSGWNDMPITQLRRLVSAK